MSDKKATIIELKQVIEEIAKGVLSNEVFTKKVHAKLIKLDPLKFKINDKIFIEGPLLISPKYRVFTKKDLGKTFVFEEDFGGQQYIYCYEATKKPGENGVPYKWRGEIECNIHGTCPEGPVTVTHGTIEVCTHIEGVNE